METEMRWPMQKVIGLPKQRNSGIGKRKGKEKRLRMRKATNLQMAKVRRSGCGRRWRLRLDLVKQKETNWQRQRPMGIAKRKRWQMGIGWQMD